MPLDATRNSLVLPILGLLVEQPGHAYDVAARLTARYPHLKTPRSSVVTLLKSLTDSGFVFAGTPERVANRPARTAYQPTDEGIALFRTRVREGLTETAAASTDFITAVAYLGILPAADAIAVLRARVTRLREETPVIPPGLPEIQMIEVHYWLRVLDTEITWLTLTAGRLESGELKVLV